MKKLSVLLVNLLYFVILTSSATTFAEERPLLETSGQATGSINGGELTHSILVVIVVALVVILSNRYKHELKSKPQ